MNPDRDVIRSAQLLLEHMPDPMGIIHLDNRLIWGNDAFRSRFGDSGTLLNDGGLYVIPDFKTDEYGAREKKGNCTLTDRNGSRISFQYDAAPICNDGETISYTVLLKEVEEKHPIDQAPVQPDDIYRMVADNISDVIVLVDNDAVVRFVSPSITTVTGYSVDEYEGMDAFGILHPDDRERVRRLHAEAVQTKRSVDLEYRLLHAQGHTVYIEARVKPVLDGEGHVQYVVAVARDATERKQSERLLENILDNVNAVVLSTDKDFTRYSYCSENFEKMSGVSRLEAMNNPMRAHDTIHPDDNAVLMTEVKEKLDKGMPVRQEFRWIYPEGGMRWGNMIIHPYLDHAGAIERIDFIILDITDKKHSELALEESEQRYKSLFENNLDGVFSIELSGFYFVNANRSFEQITGIQFDILNDRCFFGLIKDEDHPTVYEALFHVIQRKESRDIECRITGAGQVEKIVSITFVPIFLSGELNGIHGIVKDITERKREERELIQREERYKALQQSLNRFSSDLANVMKVSELENRLIEEVKAVLRVSRVSIEEVPRGREREMMNDRQIWVKIGEKRQPVYLRIEMGQAMLKIEEEWLDTAVHYVTILYDNLHLLEDLMRRLEDTVANNETPKWMLRLLFQLSEKERASLSGDLHDSVLQDLIIWYRKLESLRSSVAFAKETQHELKQIEEGLLDAIHQLRITCNELRPPFLLKMGLAESLKSLFSYTRMFSNYEIEFSSEPMDGMLQEEQILGLYRIVQELLNNANKHSGACKVSMTLNAADEHIRFTYSDDGVGMDLSAFEGSFQHMGIAGIEKRVLSLDGEMELESAPQKGFHVWIRIPAKTQLKGERYGNLIG